MMTFTVAELIVELMNHDFTKQVILEVGGDGAIHYGGVARVEHVQKEYINGNIDHVVISDEP